MIAMAALALILIGAGILVLLLGRPRRPQLKAGEQWFTLANREVDGD